MCYGPLRLVCNVLWTLWTHVLLTLWAHVVMFCSVFMKTFLTFYKFEFCEI